MVHRRLCLASSALLAAACATAPPPQAAALAPPPVVAPGPEIVQRADADRVRALELEVALLRADLHAAEETLLAAESGMRGAKGKAEAVSALAEARIAVDRAARRAPWRDDAAAEAREKLAEADRQLAADRIGSAFFFLSRAQRIADALEDEAARVRANPATRFVGPARVNLRAAPHTEAAVLATLPAAWPVFVEAREGGWALVRTSNGRVGFVRADLLAETR